MTVSTADSRTLLDYGNEQARVFTANVRIAMTIEEMSPRQLAEHLGISKSAAAHKLSRCYFTVAEQAMIAALFERDVEWFFREPSINAESDVVRDVLYRRAFGSSLSGLPRLDSNQQPAGYPPPFALPAPIFADAA